MRSFSMPKHVTTAVLHTRYGTKGSEMNPLNNHPIAVRGVVGVHNGMVWNDDDIFADLAIEKERLGQVDSEAIFAALAYGMEADPVLENTTRIPGAKHVTDCLEVVGGSAAVAWVNVGDERNQLHIARLDTAPLVWAQTVGNSFVFASTEEALLKAINAVHLEVRHLETMKEGTYHRINQGRVDEAQTFRAMGSTGRRKSWTSDRSYNSAWEWSDDMPTMKKAVVEVHNPRFVSSEYLDARRELSRMDSDTHDKVYRKRTNAIEDFENGVRGTDGMGMAAVWDCKGFVRQGDWVVAQVNDTPHWAQVVRLPDEFPEGHYILRVWLNNYDCAYVARGHYEFEWSTKWQNERFAFETKPDEAIRSLDAAF